MNGAASLKHAKHERLVLVIDGDEFLANLFRFKLEAAGFHASTACSPTQIWQAVGTLKPDLVIVDLMLLDPDPYSLIKKLTGGKRDGKPTVIAMSRVRDEGCDQRVAEAGAALCLVTTTCTPAELVLSVKKLLKVK